MIGAEKFHEDMKNNIQRYKELDYESRKILKYKSYLDELYDPIDKEMKALKGTFYSSMKENGLGGYSDDDIKLSLVSGHSRYVLADGVDDKVVSLLISKGYIVEKITSGYCKAKVVDSKNNVDGLTLAEKAEIDNKINSVTREVESKE